MELLKSKRFKLPDLYYVTDREEIKELPIGVPFIYGEEDIKESIIRMLEYEVLYQKAVASGIPFDFKALLKSAGFFGEAYGYGGCGAFIDYTTDETFKEEYDIEESTPLFSKCNTMSNYIKDLSVYVDIAKLKELKVMPTWLQDVEDAIGVNIHNFSTFDYNLYNKKLGGMFGGITLTPQPKNLIIVDISGSIPRGVSSTCLMLAKNMAESFYADLIITGTISTLYEFENVHELDVDNIYDTNGMCNDQNYFKKLVTSEKRVYGTAIVFGDNDHPGYPWQMGSVKISDKDGQDMCLWEIETLVSAHTKSNTELAGYSRWFSPDKIKHITNWVKYLN